MNYQEIPLLDYIDEDDSIDVYIHTKDNRVVKLEEIKTNLYIDNYQVSIDHMWFGQRMSFVMLREDFSYMRYIVKNHTPEKFDSKKAFDVLNSFIDDEYPPESLREP